LLEFLRKEYGEGKIIFPARENILRAIQTVDLPEVKVVILGQDPYHGDNQATGFSFAVPNTLRLKPPSLQNIFKEIASDIGSGINPTRSDLTGWVNQGVLLLNTVLTVERGKAFSHREKGWEVFTDKIISHLNTRKEPLVFILWGAAAQKKSALINGKHHHILASAHPSPFSAEKGFFGCRHFSKTNEILKRLGQKPIDWIRTSDAKD